MPTSPNAYAFCDTALGFIGGILCGVDKLARVAHLAHDPAVAEVVGIEAVPSQSTLSRFFAQCGRSAGEALSGLHRWALTDQSSTATHPLRRGSRERGFNPEYLAFCAHLGLDARTINKESSQENGVVESARGHLKRRLEAHLMLRVSRVFAREADYAAFVAQVCRGANGLRQAKVSEEIAVLRPLPATRYPEAEEMAVRVSSFSTARRTSAQELGTAGEQDLGRD